MDYDEEHYVERTLSDGLNRSSSHRMVVAGGRNVMQTEAVAVGFECGRDGIVAVAANCRVHQACLPALGRW